MLGHTFNPQPVYNSDLAFTSACAEPEGLTEERAYGHPNFSSKHMLSPAYYVAL